MQNIHEKYDSLVKITKFSQKHCKSLLNWMGRQNILVQTDIFREQRNQFFKLKNDAIRAHHTEIIPLAAFYLALDKYYQLLDSNKKNKSLNIEEAAKLTNFSIKQTKKIRKKEKREKLLNLWSKVIELHDKNFSFREIEEYLRGRHRFSVSHTYICNLWQELENGS